MLVSVPLATGIFQCVLLDILVSHFGEQKMASGHLTVILFSVIETHGGVYLPPLPSPPLPSAHGPTPPSHISFPLPSLEALCIKALVAASGHVGLPSCAVLTPHLAHTLLTALVKEKQLHPKTMPAFHKWCVCVRVCVRVCVCTCVCVCVCLSGA